MTETATPTGGPPASIDDLAAGIRRRQMLLLGGIAAVIVSGTVMSVWLTGSPESAPATVRPKATPILAPGAQVDPRDAWRGQADAQLKAIEQRSRELTQRGSELDGRSREMLQRLERLEASGRNDNAGLTPLPPPPLPAPALRPEFGPDPQPPGAGGASVPRLPPQPLQAGRGTGSPTALAPPPGAPPGPIPAATSITGMSTSMSAGMSAGTGIVSITLADAPTAKAEPSAAKTVPRDTRHYLPGGSFVRAVLLGGLDAPTGGQAQRNPQPVLLRLTDHAVLPNEFRGRVKACFVVGAGYGDVSAERAYIRTESLSCVTREGNAIDVPIKGYVAGEDGKAGMRGRLVSKQGQILANALLAGVASGIGTAFQQGATTVSVSPLGSTGTVEPDRQLQAGLGSGVGKALDRLAQYYITLAEKVFPVIEVDAGRSVDVVLTQGIALSPPLHAGNDDERHPRATSRRSTHAWSTDDEDDDE